MLVRSMCTCVMAKATAWAWLGLVLRRQLFPLEQRQRRHQLLQRCWLLRQFFGKKTLHEVGGRRDLKQAPGPATLLWTLHYNALTLAL